ncbi:ADP-glyceromanno-heptose 6-epimerase [Pontibacter sp. G13]|uniref:ADP-glyceromanno-heptose 6-epimerase n=1 Tax=Pontibacter sp. G13 TaxID=3074898 RepID=UPI00288BD19C|nr:ADP-glyceromanno-heptose 6-epimerase [Pontibacter sp. G13]WNJ20383.1 ADP-glyceromanno-heptose 6-epimerase [Pontibacter sp. G13]
MIVLTGAAGFIGSCVAQQLIEQGHQDLVLVDRFDRPAHEPNYRDKAVRELVHRDQFFEWAARHAADISLVIHLGARTDTAEFDEEIFNRLNLHYSQEMWKFCTLHQIPLIYASSAATYGDGSLGFVDSHEVVSKLHPLNPYGWSKQRFDQWALAQEETPPFWAGLKFFNVYGPNEYHKGRMASVVFHAFNQIQQTGKLKLFKSHRPDFEHGQQSRDFIYVRDLVRVISFLSEQSPTSGLYNLGTGIARPFLDLGKQVFYALGLEPQIEFIDTPLDIRETYQYFTQADMTKLSQAGYQSSFTTLEEGIQDYVTEFLVTGRCL